MQERRQVRNREGEMKNEWIQGGWVGGRVECSQNQHERHVERLVFLILITQNPVAWRLGGPGDEEMGQEWSKSWGPRP